MGWHVLGPILPNLLVALLFLWSLPQFVGLPWTGLVRLLPDFGVALIGSGLLGLGWSVARTLWIWPMLRRAHYQSLSMQVQAAVAGD